MQPLFISSVMFALLSEPPPYHLTCTLSKLRTPTLRTKINSDRVIHQRENIRFQCQENPANFEVRETHITSIQPKGNGLSVLSYPDMARNQRHNCNLTTPEQLPPRPKHSGKQNN